MTADNIMTRERPDVGSYEDILAAAVRTTGLSDTGGTAHEEGLRILVEDLSSPEAGLTPRGNYFHRSEVKAALVGRLQERRARRGAALLDGGGRSGGAPPRPLAACPGERLGSAGRRAWSDRGGDTSRLLRRPGA